MAGITGILTNALLSRLHSSTDGVNARVGAIEQADPTLTTLGIREVISSNTPAEISEKSREVLYPALAVYCDKLSNNLTEKFREFSGTAHMVVEVRHSQTVLTGIEANLQLFVDAVSALLDESRGDWGSGTFYTGGYEINYEPVVRGGRNFLQQAKVGFDVEVSR
jgi:hypothetical protein